MKILISITNADIVRKFYELTGKKCNILISYNNLKGNAYKLFVLYRNMINLLYLDSGAWAMNTGRAVINVSEYKKYIGRYGDFCDQIFSLDEDFNNPERNMNNQIFLETDLPPNQKRPIPVIHDEHDPLDELQSYVDMGHDYIAIGSNRKLDDEVFEEIRKRHPDLKLHMFGNMNRRMMLTHKPYSVDSATWAHAAAFGNILYFDPVEEKEHKIYVGEKERPKEKKYIFYEKFYKKDNVAEFLRETFGYTYADLLNAKEPQFMVNMYFFTQLEDFLNRKEQEAAEADASVKETAEEATPQEP